MLLKCDCGNELVYEVDKVITYVRYKIRKDGRLYKKPIKETNSTKGENYNIGRLVCLKCWNVYEFNMLFKNKKVIRGEKLD